MATLLLIVIYASFISLGLPDSLLGVSWPLMQPYFKVPFGFAGLVSMTISGGTIVSSLLSSRALRRFGTGKVTAISVLMTAVALLGISLAPSFAWLFLLALPLGLGAGAVDSGLNEYVAEHYASRHMSWLHCFWGVGALSGPLIMSRYTALGESWRTTYRTIAIIQFVLVAVIGLSLPLWGKAARAKAALATEKAPVAPEKRSEEQSLLAPLKLGGIKIALVSFLFYCGAEASMGLWGASFLVKTKGLDAATAASWVSLFYGGITLGRLLSGFVSMAVKNKTLIRGGELTIIAGALILILPLPAVFTLVAFILIGLGCAPIYPSMLHETPRRFGLDNAQTVMGFQMAVAYIGSTCLPPLFGLIASNTTTALLPFFILFYAAAMLLSSEKLNSYLARRADTL
jgi:fucose permease